MDLGPSWAAARPITHLRAADLETSGVVFEHDGYFYRTTGKMIGHGGMGNAFLLARRQTNPEIEAELETVVGKAFHSEYLYQLRTDEVTRRDHETVLRNIRLISRLNHPHLLPTLISEPIADNHLTVSPLKAETLRQAIAAGNLSPRKRVKLLMQTLSGLASLHESRFIHRDVTLRNILVDDDQKNTFLFDFDLTLSMSDVAGMSYKERYQGRIFGSPGYSVPPEILDSALMECPITTRLDIYAVGGAIFALFTDKLPYGSTEDMWGLLLRISDGVVFNGESRIVYPESVPQCLRPIIERCMERDPGNRYDNVNIVLAQLDEILDQLPSGEPNVEKTQRTLRYGDRGTRVQEIIRSRPDESISADNVEEVDMALERYGYHVQRALGRVKGHAIFMAAPIPELVAQGNFPDANTYPKIVTAIDLKLVDNREEIVDLWLGGYLPILRSARQGLLTSLYRVSYDEYSRNLFLFSEYVDDARFGPQLDDHDLSLGEALGLAYLIARQVRRLHKRGMAHNNVGAHSLLFKGVREHRVAKPAMVGIVAPSLNRADMVADVRRLAGLFLSWLRPTRIEAAEQSLRTRLDELRSRLAGVAFDESQRAPDIEGLIDIVSDGLSSVDFNFGVLRENMGDLDEYALLRVSYSLYNRLWD